jgi:hypothetical protein
VRATAGTDATTSPNIVSSHTCTISGSNVGRFFISKIRATAVASNAHAPSPYTVSVGKATTAPLRKSAAARSIVS